MITFSIKILSYTRLFYNNLPEYKLSHGCKRMQKTQHTDLENATKCMRLIKEEFENINVTKQKKKI